MNPINLWSSMKASTKMTIVIVLGLIVMVSMFTGNFEAILSLFQGE